MNLTDADRAYLHNKLENSLLLAAVPAVVAKVEELTGKPTAFSVFSEREPCVLIVSGNARFWFKLDVQIEDRALRTLIRPLMK